MDHGTRHEALPSLGFNLSTGEAFRLLAAAEQQSVRWLAGALGGAGIALAAGVGLANVPALDAYQPLALAGALVGLAGIVGCLWLVFQAVRPGEVVVAESIGVVPPRSGPHGDQAVEGDLSRPLEVLALSEHANLKVLDIPLTKLVRYSSWSNADDIIDALDTRDTATKSRNERARGLASLPVAAAHIAWLLPAAGDRKDPLAVRLAELVAALDQLQGYLELQRVHRQVRRARRALPFAAATTVVGLGLLLGASAQADDVAAPQPISAPVRVLAFLGPQDLDLAGSARPQTPTVSGCTFSPAQPVDAVAVGGTWNEPSLLVQGGEGCRVVRFLAHNDTVIVPAQVVTAPVAVRAWLGATHRAELRRARPGAAGECAAVGGPVEATALAGTWTRPQLVVHAVPGQQPGGPKVACAAVRLGSIDSGTVVQPLSKP